MKNMNRDWQKWILQKNKTLEIEKLYISHQLFLFSSRKFILQILIFIFHILIITSQKGLKKDFKGNYIRYLNFHFFIENDFHHLYKFSQVLKSNSLTAYYSYHRNTRHRHGLPSYHNHTRQANLCISIKTLQ